MLKRTFRMYALSLAGGALLLGGATVAVGAMTLPVSLPGVVTEQATPAIVTEGADSAKVEQVWWRGRGWHRGWGWRHRGYGWHRGWGWRGYYGAGRWCYFHPYAC
ncbi:MAG: DUF5320 domain-containing protein [Pseudomonadota bacterium]|nr:DUF5320 domain-containing protein [Pseudomonadota bacterium]